MRTLLARLVWWMTARKSPVGLRIAELDGHEVALVAGTLGGINVYHGDVTFKSFALSPVAARRVAMWLIWWWIVHTWCGLRTRLEWWALDTRINRRYVAKDDRTGGNSGAPSTSAPRDPAAVSSSAS